MERRTILKLGLLTFGSIFLYYRVFLRKNNDENLSDDNTENSDDNLLNNDDKKNKSILFVGDSISIDRSGNKPLNFTYTALIRDELKPKGIDVDVLAIGGKRTSWMLENLPKKLSNKKYNKVYIYGGTNDMFSSTTKQTAYNNIQKMVDLSIKNGAKPYVIIGYDARKTMTKEKLVPTKYVDTKDKMFKLAQRYFDFQDNMKSNIKNANIIDIIDIGTNAGDGVHPNKTGHKKLRDAIIKTI